MKKLIAVSVAGAMLLFPALEAGAAKKKAKPATVFTDATGDIGSPTTGTLPAGAEAGVDLTKGVIGQKGKNLLFTATHAQMPDSGSLPEAARLVWGLVVGGDDIYQLTIKSRDIGKPDVVASALTQAPQGTERVGTVYEGVARLEQCGSVPAPVPTVNFTFSTCQVLGYHDAIFDASKASVTFEIPLKSLKAKKGSEIAGGGILADTACHVCWVLHYGERSLTPHTILDNATPTKAYKVR